MEAPVICGIVLVRNDLNYKLIGRGGRGECRGDTVVEVSAQILECGLLQRRAAGNTFVSYPKNLGEYLPEWL